MNPMRLLKILLLCLASTAAGAQSPTPASLERALAGRWQGHLEYRDYQSNQRVRLPLQTELRAGSDGVTLLRESLFDEGAGRPGALITSLALYADDGLSVTSTAVRRGRPVQTTVEQARVVEHRDGSQWVAEWRRRDQDGGQDSDIRVTLTRRGDELRALKEVRPAGAEAVPWAFRNETVLTRRP